MIVPNYRFRKTSADLAISSHITRVALATYRTLVVIYFAHHMARKMRGAQKAVPQCFSRNFGRAPGASCA